MTLREPNDPITLRSVHRITFTNGAERWGMAGDSTQRLYLTEGPRGNGFVGYFSLGHSRAFSSTAAAESFITDQLSGTVP